MEGFPNFGGMGGGDPFSAAAMNMTAANQPDLMAQLLGRLGIPPPQNGMMPPGGIGMALGGPMPQTGQGLMGPPEQSYAPPQEAMAPAMDPASAVAPPAAAGVTPGAAAGMAALGRGLLASKQGSTDVRPQFSGGITQAGHLPAPRPMPASPGSLAMMQQLLQPRPQIPNMQSLGMLLGGR